MSLSAQLRTIVGKRVKSLRRSGWTPANVYGGKEPSLAIQVRTRELERLLTHVPRTALIALGVDGQELTVLVRGVDRKPTTDELYHVDFSRVSMTEELRATVPLVLVGESPAAKLHDATVLQELDQVSVQCLPADLPVSIEVSLDALTEIGSAVLVRDLPTPPRVAVLNDPDEIVVHVVAPRLMAEEAEAAVEAAEKAAEAGGEAGAQEQDEGEREA